VAAHSSRSTRRSQSIFLTKSGFRSRGRRHVVEATEHPNGSPRQGLIASIISAAADTDPTTIATLAVVGSTTTYALGWLVLLVIPMLAVVQAIASQIGMVTRRGLEDLVRERFGRATALALLLSVLAVDVMTFAADLEGGGAAMELLVPFDYRWWIAPLALWSVSILAWGDYRRVQGVLGYLPLVFVAYAVAAFTWRSPTGATSCRRRSSPGSNGRARTSAARSRSSARRLRPTRTSGRRSR
jgi:Mn2+/Fe2+ NRAMP family transporter